MTSFFNHLYSISSALLNFPCRVGYRWVRLSRVACQGSGLLSKVIQLIGFESIDIVYNKLIYV